MICWVVLAFIHINSKLQSYEVITTIVSAFTDEETEAH